MKADCETCKHFTSYGPVPAGEWLGYCSAERIKKPITSFTARNCDGFGYEAKNKPDALQEIDIHPEKP